MTLILNSVTWRVENESESEENARRRKQTLILNYLTGTGTYRSHNCIACPWLIEQGKAYSIHDPELLTEGTWLNEL